jgi:actin-related protein
LPDGGELSLNDQRFRCGELLFKPNINGFELQGIDRAVFESIKKCPIDVKKDLYANIVMFGGTTQMNGFAERLDHEIMSLAPSTMRMRIVHPPECAHSVWIGGSILGSLPTFRGMLMTREHYNDSGPYAVHQRCP